MLCVCVLTGEDKGAGSEASSAVSIIFQKKKGTCARVAFEFVHQCVSMFNPTLCAQQPGPSLSVSAQYLRLDPRPADHFFLDVQLHRDTLLYTAKSTCIHTHHRDTPRYAQIRPSRAISHADTHYILIKLYHSSAFTIYS